MTKWCFELIVDKGVDLVDHVDNRRMKDKLGSRSTLKKVIIIGVIMAAVAIFILNSSAIIFFFQGYRKVIVSEGQVSIENFGSENSPKTITFMKEGKYLYVLAGITSMDIQKYIPVNGMVYHVNGFEIVVSEVHQDWFVVLVKPEWED